MWTYPVVALFPIMSHHILYRKSPVNLPPAWFLNSTGRRTISSMPPWPWPGRPAPKRPRQNRTEHCGLACSVPFQHWPPPGRRSIPELFDGKRPYPHSSSGAVFSYSLHGRELNLWLHHVHRRASPQDFGSGRGHRFLPG
jgi:hypothetical protein